MACKCLFFHFYLIFNLRTFSLISFNNDSKFRKKITSYKNYQFIKWLFGLNKEPIDAKMIVEYLENPETEINKDICHGLIDFRLNELILSYKCDGSNIEKFHPTLTHLKIVKAYNVKTNIKLNNLPSKLISLIIHDDILQTLDNLPSNLKILVILGNSFNYPVDRLSKSLTYLKLGNMFSHPIDNLPSSIINLLILSNKIPSFDNLYLNSKMLNLRYLEIGFDIFYFSDIGYTLESFNNLPQNLTHLVINKKIAKPLGEIPLNITNLKIYKRDIKTLGPIPTHINYLVLNGKVILNKTNIMKKWKTITNLHIKINRKKFIKIQTIKYVKY